MAQQSGTPRKKPSTSQKPSSQQKTQEKDSKGGVPVVLFILVLVLLLGAVGYIVYDMQWGSKKQMASELEVKTANAEILVARVDSLVEVNNILAEHNPSMDGVFYEVQIGAFQEFNLNNYLEEFANLKGEVHDGMDKYILAKFRTYSKAKRFRRDVQKIGIQDAFIVKKRDGQRVNM